MLEEQGHASLVCDLLRLRRSFAWRRYRVDLLGFLAAWLLVAAMIGFYFWMSHWGL
jgi:hypothetical protein